MAETYRYKRAMIIDDNNLDQFIIEKVVRQQHLADEILIMSSPRLAIDYIRLLSENNIDNIPDVIFLNHQLPDFDGFDFLDAYHVLPINAKKQSVYLLSLFFDKDEKERAVESPYVIDAIEKPLTAQKLQCTTETASSN